MLDKFLRKVTSWYFTKWALPYWCIIIVDCLIVFLSGILVFYIHQRGLNTFLNSYRLFNLWMVYILPFPIFFHLFHTYSGVIRYTSMKDLNRLGMANFLATFVLILIHKFVPWELSRTLYSISDLLLIFFISLALMWALRILVNSLYDISLRSTLAKKTFIYGDESFGEGIAKSVLKSNSSMYILAGFITTRPISQGRRFLGVPIFQESEDLLQVMKKLSIEAIMVCPSFSNQFRKNTKLVDSLIHEHIQILMLPPAFEWDGKSPLNHTAFKEVNVEDLLPRNPIEINMQEIKSAFGDKCILITGAAGSIGRECVRQLASINPGELVLVDQAETPMHSVRLEMAQKFPWLKVHTIVTSITNHSRMEHIFATYHIDYVLHAAAYKHVPMMEDNPFESVENNIVGTRILADLSVAYSVKKFVMISTDKAVNPTNVMGCSKRICEIYVQSLDSAIKRGEVAGITQFVTTRFGNVLGSNGSVIHLFRQQIKEGGPVTVTHPDVIRYFMLIPEACKLVMEAGVIGNGGEIFVFNMGQPVRIADLAERMIRLSGADNIKIKYVGLRDGEKLYEEVLDDKETVKPTRNPNIKIAQVREYDYATICKQLDELQKVVYRYDDMETVCLMKKIVPEFKSAHSKFNALDK